MKKVLTKLKKFEVSKRQKIILTSLILGIGFALTTHSDNIINKRYYVIFLYGIFAYVASFLSLWEGWNKESFSSNKTKMLLLFILPSFFCMAIASFYFVLQPQYIRWITRIPVAAVTAAVMYLLLLSQNVFNVASKRTIPLYRAASTSSLLFTLITAFLLFNVLYTFRQPFYFNGLYVALVSFILCLQMLWTLEMDKITPLIFAYSLVLGLLAGEFALALSFWPISPLMWSIALSSTLYVYLGILTHFLRERLNTRLVGEYVVIGLLVFISCIILTSWTG